MTAIRGHVKYHSIISALRNAKTKGQNVIFARKLGIKSRLVEANWYVSWKYQTKSKRCN